MTLETQLRSAMADAVATTHPDTDRLVADARRRGLGIRRRRQALSVVGVAAALAVAVTAPTVVAGDHGTTGDHSTLVGSQPGGLDTSHTEALTGRSTAAALLYAVGLEVRGTASDIRGAADGGAYAESYVIFRFTPEGDRVAGEVAVNVQPRFAGGGVDKVGADSRAKVGQCESFMSHCRAITLADGSRLTTYDDPSSYSSGIRRVASLYRPDTDFRVIASATNGYDITERAEKVTREEPVLTTDQLVSVVTQPWWGPRLPAPFTAQGAKLQDYSDRSASAVATASPSAKP